MRGSAQVASVLNKTWGGKIMFLSRVLRILSFDALVFEEVEGDPNATWQAVAVVVLSSLATGLAVGGLFDRRVSTFVLTSSIALVTWIAWAVLTLQIGTRWLPEADTRATLGEMLRTTGFAAAPGLIQVLAVFPRVAAPLIGITTVWMFAAMVVAVKHALDYQRVSRAVAVCAIGAAVSIAIAVGLALIASRTVA